MSKRISAQWNRSCKPPRENTGELSGKEEANLVEKKYGAIGHLDLLLEFSGVCGELIIVGKVERHECGLFLGDTHNLPFGRGLEVDSEQNNSTEAW